MKAVCVLVIVASFVACSEAQDFLSLMMLSNMLGGGNESPGRSGYSQGGGAGAGAGAGAGSAGSNAASKASYGGASQGGRGGGENGFMQMGAVTGQFGDMMRDMSLCAMLRGSAGVYEMCRMQAMGFM
ncbi:hypothetical protein MAR_005105 [Mya arenaria]|uniref:Uncharacterized protein n=1 Tax=Mya arenaria TaxID=6604 RepID=A0ABY7EYN2_MYAAR|nr:uncharacterized protein LOC128203229 [Mya arenaria]WAR15000.1 hypothetical protein MAR_005105 [Mya arenaria]